MLGQKKHTVVATIPTPTILVVLDSQHLNVGDLAAHSFKFDISKLQSGSRLQSRVVSAFIPSGCMNPYATRLGMEEFDGVSTTYLEFEFDWTVCVDYASLLTELNLKTANVIEWTYKDNIFFDGAQVTKQLVAKNLTANVLTILADCPFVVNGVGILGYYEVEDIIIKADPAAFTFNVAPMVASEDYYFVCDELARTNRGFAVGDSVPGSAIAMISGVTYDSPIQYSTGYDQSDFFVLNYDLDSTVREVNIRVLDMNKRNVIPLPGMGPVLFRIIMLCNAE